MIILLHSSKTMRQPTSGVMEQKPQFLKQATELHDYLASLSTQSLVKSMHISDKVAVSTRELIAAWGDTKTGYMPAIDTFRGDIYSGFQASTLSEPDREYANQHLRILSGMYGILKPLDSIQPYRLEMGYRFNDEPYKNLYTYWGESLAKTLDDSQVIINTSSAEYTKSILPYITSRVITPRFLTISPKTGEPSFVVVHAKIARGAFARWLIVNRITEVDRLKDFTDLQYSYDPKLSSEDEPVYVCREFGGIGLSVRLQD